MSKTELSSALKSDKCVLRDLEVLLKRQLGNSLIIDDVTTSDLIAHGENWSSTILRVDLVIRRDGQGSEPEELFLVAKMVPPTESQRIIFNSPVTFKKEIYMFTKISPAYSELERESGIPETEVFNLLPKFFGARLSLDEAENKFDENAVILMENLKMKNYACGNRKIGCDLTHAKMVVLTVARFHATGIAMKLKKPVLFEEIKTYAKSETLVEDFLANCDEFFNRNLKKIPAVVPYLPRIEKVISRSASDYYKLNADFEPWGTIIHADFWMNNVMFRHNENGNLENIKFVDFQDYMYFNPIRDLVHFLFTSCEKKVRTEHIQELCDLYHESLTSHLARLQCDINPFNKDSFNKRFAVTANLEYVRCILFTQIATVDAKTISVGGAPQIFEVECSEDCVQRMAEITLKFITENWI